ncbi:TolC family protein [Muricoccus vinaceus]|uniref:TolC family protein n=1 Tax=Muricoccus vinaceus TaxID=424704 RepID=A0ABV6IVR4_9PROT
MVPKTYRASDCTAARHCGSILLTRLAGPIVVAFTPSWTGVAEAREPQVRTLRTGEAVLRVASQEEAVSAVLQRSPALAAAQAAVDASRGSLTQAGARPNPAVSITAENIAGSGAYRGTSRAETTYELSQLLEVGGQRGARVGVAQRDLTLAGRDLDATRLNLVRAARQAYAEAIAMRRASRLAADSVRLAEGVLRIARERVSAGREPYPQQRRAEVSLASVRLARQRAEDESGLARRALAVLLAVPEVDLGTTDAWFNDIGPGPANRPARDPEANPDFARWREEVARADAALQLERRRAVPDLRVGAAIRRLSGTDDTAMVLNFSVPLPIFDRNQGNIARAGAERSRTERLAELNQIAIGAGLLDTHQRLETAWREADGLRRVVVPGAEEAFAFAREGYSAGKFQFLEVLDAQRVLFEARAQLNLALRDYHLRRADADRLTGNAPHPLTPSARGDSR